MKKYLSVPKDIRHKLEKNNRVTPCDTCGNNKWRTIHKNRVFICRVCNNMRLSSGKNESLIDHLLTKEQ